MIKQYFIYAIGFLWIILFMLTLQNLNSESTILKKVFVVVTFCICAVFQINKHLNKKSNE